jgi:hypothetical protein
MAVVIALYVLNKTYFKSQTDAKNLNTVYKFEHQRQVRPLTSTVQNRATSAEHVMNEVLELKRLTSAETKEFVDDIQKNYKNAEREKYIKQRQANLESKETHAAS